MISRKQLEDMDFQTLLHHIKNHEEELLMMENEANKRASSVEGEQNRKFAMISTGHTQTSGAGLIKQIMTISHIDAAKVLQDGVWKKVAFPTMIQACILL